MVNTHNLYDKYCKGDKLTNEEVVQGATFFRQLSNQLFSAGPAFAISAKEACRTASAFEGFAQARGLKLTS